MIRSSDILSLSGEAAVLIQRGKITYANAAAVNVLGEGCTGKSLRDVFGPEVASAQSGSFVADVTVEKERYIVRMTRLEELQILFFSRPDCAPAVLNDPFLCFARSTLMNMLISAGRLREQAEKAENSAMLEDVSILTRSCYQLNRLISNVSLVLDISRGLLPVNIVETDLSRLCGEIVETAAFFCPGIRFSVNVGEGIHCPADAGLVSQLLLNLLSNCLVHAKGCTHVHVNLIDAGESVVLSVGDDGEGMAPEKLHTVFDRYRHGFDITAMNSGVGLGLTVARNVAQIHGGTLLLESRPDRGTSVRASLYRRAAGTGALRAPKAEPEDHLRLTLTGLADCLPASCFREKYMD